LDGNNGEADDRIIAIPDGALVLITNKRYDESSRLIWSLQAGALAFEVLTLLKFAKSNRRQRKRMFTGWML
jgi:hypothetical protein